MPTSFNLKSYLRDAAITVDNALEQVLPAGDTRPAILHDAMRYSVFSGGKRIRPILCLAAADAAGGTATAEPGPALCSAVAVELLHTYTLIHDDLPCMDDDSERRGKPTAHIVYGEANALLAGDALQTLAFEQAAEAQAGASPEFGNISIELAQAAGSRGVIGGQVEDLAAAEGPLTDETLQYVHRHKTALLFRAAIRMGALAADAPQDTLESLTRYAEALGMAFQVVDDILDAEQDNSDGSSTREAGMSCLRIMSLADARKWVDSLTQASAQALSSLPGQQTEVLSALVRHLQERTS